MPRRKQSPVPQLISTEELENYPGISLRVIGTSVHASWRDPATRTGTTRFVGKLKSKPKEIVRELNQLQTQLFLGGPIPKTRAHVPLSLLWEDWAAASKLRHNTMACYTSAWDHHLSVLADRNAVTLTTEIANRWLDQEEDADRLTPAMRTKTAILLRHLLDRGYTRGMLSRNEGIGIKGGNESKNTRKDSYLERYEAEQLIEAVRKLDPYYVPHIYTLLWTGVRIGELAALHWNHDIDLDHENIHIVATLNDGEMGRPKSDAGRRTIPLTPTLCEELRAFQEWQKNFHPPNPQGLAFTTKRGHPLNDNTFRGRVFNPAVRACGFSPHLHITPHSLRHTFLTLLADEGVPIHVLMYLAGHTDYRMTQARYLGRTPKSREAARASMSTAFAGTIPDYSDTPGGGYVAHGETREVMTYLEDEREHVLRILETTIRDKFADPADPKNWPMP
jgi:integrase